MPEYNRRTIVRGAAWSIPVVAVAAHAPAFAASTDPPGAGTMDVVCRTTGQGGNNCQGYKVNLNFTVPGAYDWMVTVSVAQINSSNGTVVEIKTPTPVPGGLATQPYLINAANKTMPLWFCTGSSPSQLTLQISYTVYRQDLGVGSATTRSFPSTSYTNITNVCP